MTSHTRSSGIAPSAAPVEQPAAAEARRFLLTLCRLTKPIAMPAPNTPQLKPYSFFMSRSRDRSGVQQLLLHVGYFQTRAEAEQCLKIVQATWPKAVISSVRATPPQNVPTLQAADNASLTDTQVLRILEKRAPDQNFGTADESAHSDISLLRPEDTDTRRALKEAVVRNAPVHFAVQLLWSVQPIDVSQVPRLDIFKAYTLYLTDGSRDGRKGYCLRLGFFGDPISARQVAHYVRHRFSAVAVVPIVEQEREQANGIDASTMGVAVAPAASSPHTPPVTPTHSGKPEGTRSKPRTETLEQTLEMLAASEIFTNVDSLSDTGVRHLNVTVTKPKLAR